MLGLLPVLAAGSQNWALLDAVYHSGSLVLGDGRVVLPLLQADAVAPGWVMAPPGRYLGPCSPLPPISVRSWDLLRTAFSARASAASHVSMAEYLIGTALREIETINDRLIDSADYSRCRTLLLACCFILIS